MSEPEEVILDGAHAATVFAARLWRRRAAEAEERLVLPEVRHRLQLFLSALYGEAPPLVVAEPPARPSWVGWLVRRTPRHLREGEVHASTDGERIRLPRHLGTLDREAAWRRYQLLAVEQAARAARGTARHLPRGDVLARDLYLLAEAVAVDAQIARELPGVRAELAAARAEALLARPDPALLSSPERRVEELLRGALAAPPGERTAAVPLCPEPEGSLAWARALEPSLVARGERYRGLPAVALWGRVDAEPESAPAARPRAAPHPGDEAAARGRTRTLVRRPRVRPERDDEDDAQPGIWMVQMDDPQEHVEDPLGLNRPADRDGEADPDELADSLSELPEARLVNVPGAPYEVLASEDPPVRRAAHERERPRAGGTAYPEWDYRRGAYATARAVVRDVPAPLGDLRWAEGVLGRHAGLVHQVRRRFERLRPQRVRLGRQLDGPEVDVAEYVTGYADLRAGRAGGDRLYEQVRPMRRNLAIALLVDASGSTDSWIGETRRIIDVEKEALLLVCEALDALGDRYTVMSFSGEGPEAVTVHTLKGFAERNGPAVRRRIAALEPDRYTRAGAAIRHATAALCREAARHRLLLVLSDGKPNDVDLYEGRYGIEDVRQAVAEARLQGLQPFCLTVDRQAPTYLRRIFAPGEYAVLRRAQSLPAVLVAVVQRLLAG